MAKNDIRLWRSGKELVVEHFPVAASAEFVAGEPVRLNTGGELVEAATAWATGNDFLGIALASGDTVGDTDANGAFTWKKGAFTPGDGLPNSGDLVPVLIPTPETFFITSNWTATTGAASGSPAKTNVGDGGGFNLDSGNWVLGMGVAQNARVIQVLDANYEDIAFSGGTGVYVVFVFTSAQTMAEAVNTDADA
jgi:hypothetical protein